MTRIESLYLAECAAPESAKPLPALAALHLFGLAVGLLKLC